MKIKQSIGKQFEGDKLLWFKTNNSEQWEAISLRKLLILVNKLGINEHKKYKYAKESWFELAINNIFELNKKGIDLTENEKEFLEFCNKWKLSNQKIKQTKLGEFEGI